MPSSVRVLSPSAVHAALEAIVVAYRGSGGGEVTLTFETAPALAGRLAGGEAADIVIAPPTVMAELRATGKADAEACFELGRVGVGVAVRRGAPVPDISTSATLKKELLVAESVVYTRASSGLYVAQLIERLGVAKQIKAKTSTYHDANGAFAHLLKGDGREFGFGGIPEIKRWRDQGLRYVGPLPPDIQNYTTYSVALTPNPSNPGDACAFFEFLDSPAAKTLLTANGVD